MSKISFIIVAFNSASDVKRLLLSIVSKVQNIAYEIVVVDNSDCADTKKIVESSGFKYIAVPSNPGFASACNIGVQNATSEWYFFINQDSVIDEAAELNFVDGSMTETPLILIPLVRENQWGDKYESRKMSFPLLTTYLKKILGMNEEGWYRGSALLVNKTCYKMVGGWSEDYFMYSEDLQFFYTANKKNIETRRLNLSVTHVGGSSSRKVWDDAARLFQVNKSLLIFYLKNKLIFNGLIFYSFFSIIIGLRNLDYRIPMVWYLSLINYKK